MESNMNLNNNPLLKVKVEKDENLEKAQNIYNGLQSDIQRLLIEEYITPELNGDHLIKEFDKLIESEECSRLEWQVLTDIVGKIINHTGALYQMCELNTLNFKDIYKQHFIDGIMTFKAPSWHNKPLESMCAELTMRKWH